MTQLRRILFFLFHVIFLAAYANQDQNHETFWASQAENIHWLSKWDKVLDWQPPYAKWFVGGKLNASTSCLDQHMQSDIQCKTALLWEGENGEERRISYEELFEEVNAFSASLKSLGVQKGDRIVIYLPMIPEAIIAMLSCARVGAIHTVVFAGFSADSLKDRIQDAEAKLVITSDGGYRRGKILPLKATVDRALLECKTVEKVIVVKRTHQPVDMLVGRDLDYHSLIHNNRIFCSPEPMEANDPLFILYTSGTTGKPKGIMHSTGGYLVGVVNSMRWVFDPKPQDIYWCTADVGWITGHSYIVYGPLAHGMTQLIYEGAPDWPNKDRFWKLIEKYQVSILYTAPTAIRTFMKWGEGWPANHNLSSLRLLGSVGEPLNPEAWRWYYKYIGNKKCPIVDTWWQTETGSIVIAPIPGVTKLKPGSTTKPLPGYSVAVLDNFGNKVDNGYLAITSPFPSMLLGIYKDPQRYEDTYWKKWNRHYYFTGDGASIDEDGDFWLTGRVDDVINVSGHRLGTMEIESALIEHPLVAEAAAIGIPHEIKGQAIVAFVTLKENSQGDDTLIHNLKQHIVDKIGAIARPERILFIYELPKTRSGKIMRRLLREIAQGNVLGDLSTLSDPEIIHEIKQKFTED